MVDAMRATRAGGSVRIAVEAKSLIRDVTAARADMRVKDSKLWSQNSDGPPKPLSLIIERAKSRPAVCQLVINEVLLLPYHSALPSARLAYSAQNWACIEAKL